MEAQAPYLAQPNPDAFTTYQVGLTHREWQAIKRLRQFAKIGKELALIEITKDGPRVREVGKLEG